jgi:hypothetical protein
MKLIDALRKLGIVRYGLAGGVYTSYKDMPDELMYSNVYDKKKDLVGGSDGKSANGAGGQMPAGKGPAVLFLVLLILSMMITLFFGFVVGYGAWLLVLLAVLLLFIFMLYRHQRFAGPLKLTLMYFVVYILLSVAILLFATAGSGQHASDTTPNTPSAPAQSVNTNTPGTEGAGTPAQSAETPAFSIDTTEWVEYTGVESSIFTFRYPKPYVLQEHGSSTLLFVDKNADYDYHITFTDLQGAIPVPADCEGLARSTMTGYQNGELRYAKSREFFGHTGCEYGINIDQNGSRVYEIAYNFTTGDRTFYITAYAKELSDLDILSKILQSFKLK